MFTESVEHLLNHNLPRSPRARALCAALAGRRVAITIEGLALRFLLGSDGERLTLAREHAAAPGRTPADAEFHGTPLNLLALAGPDAEGVVRRGDVRIEGDAECAQDFRELARLLRPDIEEELSQLVGDAAAHRLGRFAAGALGLGRRVASTGARNVAEYLAHERADLVPRAEADAFFADVDRAREDVDRLTARIALLAARESP
ncbi:MAG: SCP2 domain-containing protein [Steroidobacteraceae bacterium]